MDELSIKDRISKEFTNLTETQLSKLVEFYHISIWINPDINLFKFILILKSKSQVIKGLLIFTNKTITV